MRVTRLTKLALPLQVVAEGEVVLEAPVGRLVAGGDRRRL